MVPEIIDSSLRMTTTNARQHDYCTGRDTMTIVSLLRCLTRANLTISMIVILVSMKITQY